MVSTMRSEDEAFVVEQFRLHGPSVYRRARHLLGNAEDADDVMQEVFLTLARKIGSFDRHESALNWLYRVTTNRCLDLLRRKKARATFALKYRPELGQQWVPDNAVALQQVLRGFKPEEQQVLVYAYCDGMSHQEIAKILNVSARTVGNMLGRLQKRAQKKLAAATRRASKEPS